MSEKLDEVVAEVKLQVVHNFRGRAGYALVARSQDANGLPLFYEMTKQYSHIGGPVEALASSLRISTVEAEGEE